MGDENNESLELDVSSITHVTNSALYLRRDSEIKALSHFVNTRYRIRLTHDSSAGAG